MTAASWALLGLALVLGPAPVTARAAAAAIVERTGARAAGHEPSTRGSSRRPPVPLLVLAGASAVVAVLAWAGLVLGATFAVGAVTCAGLGRRTARLRTRRVQEQQLLAAIRLLVAELTAGADAAAGLAAAAEVVPRHRDDLLAAARAGRSGDRPRFTEPALAMVGHAWHLAEVTGAPVAATLGRVADDLAARIDQGRAVRIAASGAQASAAMLAVLPVLGVVLGAAMGARPLQVLFSTPTGQVLCLLGVCLDCAGVMWTVRLTARAMRR